MASSHIRIIPLSIRDLSGAADIDLPAQGIPAYAMLVPLVERTDAVAHLTRTTSTKAKVLVTTYGRTIAPIPWDGLSEPIAVKVMAAWNIIDGGGQQVFKSWDLRPAREHIIRHDMATRNFIESVRADGQAIFAGVTVLDENRIKIELTEAQSVSVSIMFLV